MNGLLDKPWGEIVSRLAFKLYRVLFPLCFQAYKALLWGFPYSHHHLVSSFHMVCLGLWVVAGVAEASCFQALDTNITIPPSSAWKSFMCF